MIDWFSPSLINNYYLNNTHESPQVLTYYMCQKKKTPYLSRDVINLIIIEIVINFFARIRQL